MNFFIIKRFIAVLFTTASMALSFPALAKGLYTGVTLGEADYSYGSAGTTSFGSFSISTEVDSDDTPLKLFVGYRFLPFLAIEGVYARFGAVEVTTRFNNVSFSGQNITVNGVTFNNDGTSVTTIAELNGFGADILGIFPIGNTVSLFGKFGALQAKDNTSGVKGVGTKLGFGLDLNLNKSFALRGEFERYDFGTLEADLINLGVIYNF